MDRLSGLDAAFLYLDTPTTHMHVGLVAVFDGSTLDGAPAHGRVLDVLRERIDLLPPFRRRLTAPGGGLLAPMWVDDPNFTIEDHVVAVPPLAAVTDDALMSVAADVMRRPLHRERPLWELYVLEGRDDRRVALIAKVHHAAIDGISGVELLANLVDMTPDAASPNASRPAATHRRPGLRDLALLATRDLVVRPFATAKAFMRTVERMSGARSEEPDQGDGAGGTRDRAARTVLTRPISDRRSVGLAALPMDDVQRVRKLAGGTVNDVVLTVCGGALKSYLAMRGDEPAASLVASVPVSLRTEQHTGTTGNVISQMTVSLHTDVDDPLDRYRAVTATTAAAKRRAGRLRAGELLSDWVSLLPPAVGRPLGRTMWAGAKVYLNRNGTLPSNVVISNIPGPPFAMYLRGMEMTDVYPLGPIVDGIPLNITVMSYRDALDVGIVACPRSVPDVDAIPWLLRAALDELVTTCGALD